VRVLVNHQLIKETNMKMKRVVIALLASVGVVWFTNPVSSLAAQGVEDPGDIETPPTAGDGTNQGAQPGEVAAVEKTVQRFVNFLRAEHVANGTTLRDRTSGTIQLRGVPASRPVLAAYLYWNYSDASAVGAATSPALFNGNAVLGTKTADNIDPCWGRAGNHTYRAVVTAFVPSANPNQDYQVVTATSGSTAGRNPWLTTPPAPATLQEGATLVVVFRGAGTSAVIIYDALSGTEFSTSLTLTLLHAPITLSGLGLYTMSGADGQRGTTGYDNSASNEAGFFNFVAISGGATVAASDWDGSTGLPLPQLWDVHTHRVSYTAVSSVVSYTAGTDCLVPVVFVLQANSP